MKLDLNCDLGESLGARGVGEDGRMGGDARMGDDERILAHVTSANIACGFHAGDPATMRRTVRAALAQRVALGAHPSLPDLHGFGRREMKVAPDEVYDLVLYQVGALAGFCRALGGGLHHVKPHGALYNMAARDPSLAQAIAQAVRDFDPALILYGLAGSALIDAGRELGLATASEVFADRTYRSDGSLTPRSQPDAMLGDLQSALAQVERMVLHGEVHATDGSVLAVQADTLCIHGDEPGAAEFARVIRAELTRRGVEIAAL